MAEPMSRGRFGIAHFFQAISKTFGGGDRRFEGSRASFISLERYILRGVSGREPSNLRSLRSSVEFLLRYGFQKGTMPPRAQEVSDFGGLVYEKLDLSVKEKGVTCSFHFS